MFFFFFFSFLRALEARFAADWVTVLKQNCCCLIWQQLSVCVHIGALQIELLPRKNTLPSQYLCFSFSITQIFTFHFHSFLSLSPLHFFIPHISPFLCICQVYFSLSVIFPFNSIFWKFTSITSLTHLTKNLLFSQMFFSHFLLFVLFPISPKSFKLFS